MAGVTGIISSIAAAGSAYASIKQAESADFMAKKQAKALGEQTEMQKKQIKKAEREAESKRIESISRQRKQLYGSGDSQYNINPTGQTGITLG
jgi:hypothetical protein